MAHADSALQGLAASFAVPDLEAFARCFRLLKLPEGAAVFHCGDRAASLFVVVEGSVWVRFDGPAAFKSPEDPLMTVLGPGMVFGLEALHHHIRPRDHTAQVILSLFLNRLLFHRLMILLLNASR